MPPDRGRASRACASCRKQKTRCYESAILGRPCLRCERLDQKCSFEWSDPVVKKKCSFEWSGPVRQEASAIDTTGSNTRSSGSVNTDFRLTQLERTVGALLERLGEDSSVTGNAAAAAAAAAEEEETETQPVDVNSSSAPVIVIRDLATEIGVKSTTTSPQNDTTTTATTTVDNLISPDLTLTLITIFLEHYGRWVRFDPESNPRALLANVSKSPLLLCACCLIAVRHTNEDLATTLAPKLYQCANSLVSAALLVSPQPVEFFQAAVVLCLWSTTIGQVPFSIDSWLLSGFALQHCQSSPLLFGPITNTNPTSSAEFSRTSVDHWCLWNHLCLVHLQYCVGTSRKLMLQAWQIERCRAIVGSDHATNYELRMVAEVFLYWTLYECSSSSSLGSVDLLRSIAALNSWKREWQFLLEQPRAQFLIMGFHFAHLILYDQTLKLKSTRARESLVAEMIRHSTAIIQVAMDTTDQRTRHLSDNIYHIITFAAVIICRLLHMFRDKVALTHSVDELDALIRDVIFWLQSIGLPCHAAYMLGNVVAVVYRKLRSPQHQHQHQQPASPLVSDSAEDWLVGDFPNYFPEFLGVGTTGDGNWDLLSSWAFQESPSS